MFIKLNVKVYFLKNMDIKKQSCKTTVFVINLLIIVLLVLGIKEYEATKFSLESTTDESVVPVDQSILDIQNQIVAVRESKLRDLNTAPKAVTQKNITTTSTTVTPPPVVTKTPDKKTKTS